MGKIHEETVDREMIAWLMLNIRYLFPYFQEAATNIKQKEIYNLCNKDKDFKFSFGIYRSINEPCEEV